jgi:hypothetical protein
MVFLLVSFIFAATSIAGPVIKHEKIVAADGSGDYLTITAALNAISDASDINRYIITVRPGIYNEVVNMKQYVDLRGSGPNNTRISSSTVSSIDDDLGTVVMASNSNFSNITIENTSSGEGVALKVPTGVINAAVDGAQINAKGNGGANVAVLARSFSIFTITNSSVYTTAMIQSGYNNHGIVCYGNNNPTKCTIKDVTVIGERDIDSGGYNSGIAIWGGGNDVSISDTTAIISGGNYAHGIENYGCTSITLNNVKAIADGGWDENNGIFSGADTGCKMTVNNSER